MCILFIYIYTFVTCIFNITSSKFAGINVVLLHIAVHATFGNIAMWLIWRHRFGWFLFPPIFFGRTGPRSWVLSYMFFWLGQVAVWILQKAPILSIPYWPILGSVWQWTFKAFQGIRLLRIVSNNSLEAFDEDFGKTLPNLTVLMAEAGWTAKVKGGIFQKDATLKSQHFSKLKTRRVVPGTPNNQLFMDGNSQRMLKNHFHPFPMQRVGIVQLKQPFLLWLNFSCSIMSCTFVSCLLWKHLMRLEKDIYCSIFQ